MRTIDLNSDLGEGFGPYTIADDAALMGLITSANVACGYHAGDPVVMDRTVRIALENGVDLGAHVAFPDRMGFGRRVMQMELEELRLHVLYQLGALDAIARAAGHRITHLNPHGALGNLACSDRSIAEALVDATARFDPDIAYLVLPGTELDKVAAERGLSTVNLFLADRAYTAQGQLAPRRLPGAVIKEEGAVVERVRRLLRDGTIETIEGSELTLDVHSILVHSDTPGSIALAGLIRRAIGEAGAEIAPLSHRR